MDVGEPGGAAPPPHGPARPGLVGSRRRVRIHLQLPGQPPQPDELLAPAQYVFRFAERAGEVGLLERLGEAADGEVGDGKARRPAGGEQAQDAELVELGSDAEAARRIGELQVDQRQVRPLLGCGRDGGGEIVGKGRDPVAGVELDEVLQCAREQRLVFDDQYLEHQSIPPCGESLRGRGGKARGAPPICGQRFPGRDEASLRPGKAAPPAVFEQQEQEH
jgi:hypothetical protein